MPKFESQSLRLRSKNRIAFAQQNSCWRSLRLSQGARGGPIPAIFLIWWLDCTDVPLPVTAQQTKVCWLHRLALFQRQTYPNSRFLVILMFWRLLIAHCIAAQTGYYSLQLSCLPQMLINRRHRFLGMGWDGTNVPLLRTIRIFVSDLSCDSVKVQH